jgi:hypothetical protein
VRRARRARVKSSAVEIKDYYHKKARIKKRQVSLFSALAHQRPGEDREVSSEPQKTKTQRELSSSSLVSLRQEGKKKKEKKHLKIERVKWTCDNSCAPKECLLVQVIIIIINITV